MIKELRTKSIKHKIALQLLQKEDKNRQWRTLVRSKRYKISKKQDSKLPLLGAHIAKALIWFDFCFTALRLILGHFGRGQLT